MYRQTDHWMAFLITICSLTILTQTSVIRAWDFDTPKPLIMAPAMNTHMWQHPFTEKHIETLREELQVEVIDPIEKELACGDKGTSQSPSFGLREALILMWIMTQVLAPWRIHKLSVTECKKH